MSNEVPGHEENPSLTVFCLLCFSEFSSFSLFILNQVFPAVGPFYDVTLGADTSLVRGLQTKLLLLFCESVFIIAFVGALLIFYQYKHNKSGLLVWSF